MTIITHNNQVYVAYSGTPPDWALEAIHKAERGENGYSRLEAAHAEYLEGDSLDDWNTEKGERVRERPAPTVDPMQALKAQESQIFAELARIDAATIRPMRAGETERVKELEGQAEGKRKELEKVRIQIEELGGLKE